MDFSRLSYIYSPFSMLIALFSDREFNWLYD